MTAFYRESTCAHIHISPSLANKCVCSFRRKGCLRNADIYSGNYQRVLSENTSIFAQSPCAREIKTFPSFRLSTEKANALNFSLTLLFTDAARRSEEKRAREGGGS